MAKVRTTIYLDSAVRQAIRKLEYQDNKPMSAIIMQAIDDYLRNRLKNKENKNT